jgi:DNA modification methylase
VSVYEGHGVTLHHGDCLDVLRTLPDASVDSVVTDPPYGLEFMGKAWDSFTERADTQTQTDTWGAATTAIPGSAYASTLPRFTGKQGASLKPFQDWCEAWATECLRVLKPGGHLLAFGGTRTWHRLACAVEDAGFEVRDSIAWLYGSGFPKSLDVSKAIDKRPGVSQHPAFAAHLAERRQSAGLSRADVSEHVVGTRTGACWNWEHHQFPEAKWWPALRDLLDLDEAKWGPIIAEAERQKIGVKAGNRLAVAPGQGEDRSAIDLDVTTHATPDAERWQGWGTALKPSFEGIVCATKPVPALARIGSRLDELEQSCIPPASGAVPSSAPTHPDSLGARAASAPASAAIRREAAPARTTPTGAAGGSSAATATSASELTGATFWNTVTSWKACWAELCEATSTSTTGTTSSTTTDLETLWSCLSQITPEGTTTDPTSPDGLSSLVGAVDAMFAAAVLNSRATRTLTAIGSATSGTPPTSPAAGGSRAAFEPVVVARKPLAGTVAANVLEHGTGALNIDGCRVGDGGQLSWAEPRGIGYMGGGSNAGAVAATENAKGRWPANVVLDESQAAALDEQSGESSSVANVRKRAGTSAGNGETLNRYAINEDNAGGFNDIGGASRFFYVAKADASERPRVNGTAHPTVKPLDLMRWLVRLVTPPGGTVLEPFAGSGTTVEACIIEGFQCIAIEKGEEYLPLITQRIHRQRNPVEAIRQTGDDLGLFELDGEGA